MSAKTTGIYQAWNPEIGLEVLLTFYNSPSL
jgi:hypothetical protein